VSVVFSVDFIVGYDDVAYIWLISSTLDSLEVFFFRTADFSLSTRWTSAIFTYVLVWVLSSLGLWSLGFLGLLEATLVFLEARAGDRGCLATGDDATFDRDCLATGDDATFVRDSLATGDDAIFLPGEAGAFFRDGDRERDLRLAGLADLDLDLLLALRLTSFSVYWRKNI